QLTEDLHRYLRLACAKISTHCKSGRPLCQTNISRRIGADFMHFVLLVSQRKTPTPPVHRVMPQSTGSVGCSGGRSLWHLWGLCAAGFVVFVAMPPGPSVSESIALQWVPLSHFSLRWSWSRSA